MGKSLDLRLLRLAVGRHPGDKDKDVNLEFGLPLKFLLLELGHGVI